MSASGATGVESAASKPAPNGPDTSSNPPAGPAPVEVEWQFDALDLRPVERFVAGGEVVVATPAGDTSIELLPLGAQQLVDTYVDTADWRIGRSGLVLRIRKKRAKHEATVKDTKPAVDGLRRRLEISEPLTNGTLAVARDGGPVSRCVWSLAGDRPLVKIFGINTRRRPFEMRIGGQVIGELALDETTIDVGPGETPLRLRRVEVEIDTTPADLDGRASTESVVSGFVERLRRECGLQPATLSKFEAGLLALGVEIPSGQDFGPTRLPASPTVGDVAYVAVRRALVQMVTREPGTRLGSDPEELHQMRVATRHMRAVLGIFATAFPVRAQQMRSEIGWLAEVLGKVRDLDVQLEQLDGWVAEARPADAQALAQLGTLLREHWAEARAYLLTALDSARYERLVTALAAMLRSGPSTRLLGARAPAPEVVESIVVLQRKAQKAASRARQSRLPADYHQLRIRCKRLRYALEYVSEVFDGKIAAYRKHIVALQTTLGNLQDAEVASMRLRTMAGADESQPPGEEPPELSAAAIFVMGQLAERYNEIAHRILEQVPHQLKLVKGPDWQHLHELMEETRQASREAAAAAPPRPPAARRTPARPRRVVPASGRPPVRPASSRTAKRTPTTGRSTGSTTRAARTTTTRRSTSSTPRAARTPTTRRSTASTTRAAGTPTTSRATGAAKTRTPRSASPAPRAATSSGATTRRNPPRSRAGIAARTRQPRQAGS
jgi:CHAD domain-containing protein